MAAKFPTQIEYTTAVPSGRGPSVPLRLDVSTGAEHIARGIENLGEAFSKIAAAKRSIDFSTKKRQIEEKSFAAVNTHKTTGDPKARKALEEQWNKDMDAISSDDPILNDAIIKYKNETFPHWGQIFANQNLTFETRNNKDAFETNLQHLMENGAVDEAAKQIHNYQVTTNQISPAEAEQMIKELPNNSILTQMQKFVGSGNPEAAIKKSKELKDLTDKQMDYRDQLLIKANKGNKQNLESYHQQYWQKLQKGNTDTIQASLNDPNNPLPVTGEGGKEWWQNLITKREEVLSQSDLVTQSKVADAVIFNPGSISTQQIRNYAGKGTKGGLSLDKVQEYEKTYALVANPNSALNVPRAKSYLNKLKQQQADRSFSINQKLNDERYGQSLDSLTNYFTNYREMNKKDPTEQETQSFYEHLVAGYRGAEAPFTEAKVQTVLGELESGGSVSIFGTVMPFSKPEDAINHVLRNLGPNWQKVAPEAAEIIKRKFPKANIEQKIITQKTANEIGDIRPDQYGVMRKWNGKGWELIK